MKKETSFGTWLYKQRRSLDLTRHAFANQVGCAEVTLRRIENSTLKPSKELAFILLEKIGIPENERAQWVAFARGITGYPEQPFVSSLVKPLTNLPSLLTTFIGRHKEQAEITQHLNKYRLVTLTGSGGVGKTRLSLKIGGQVLEDYANGVWLVELASLSDPALLPQTVTRVFGITAKTDVPLIEILTNFLRAKTTLIILDNCEHLLDACAQLTDTLLKNCPSLKILATSREPLGITGEAIYRVPSLGLPHVEQVLEKFREFESVCLFEERAQLVQTDFSLTMENTSFVAQICSLLDGIPLALELAAAKVGSLPIMEIAEQLETSFNLLTGGSRTALPRQQTIRASIDWSWNLLSDSERTFLRRLAVFAGGWTLEAAESVCSMGGIESHQTLQLMSQLVAKSLVSTHQLSGRETRFYLHETIRQYAREKLVETGEENQVRDRHLTYFLNLAEKADKEIHGAHQIEWGDRLESEHDNFNSALEWSVINQHTEIALRLLGALCWSWDVRNHYIEMETWFDRIRLLPNINNQPVMYAGLLNHVAEHNWMMGDFRNAQSLLDESCAIGLELGSNGELGLAYTLDWSGMVALWSKGDHDTAKDLFEQSFELYKKHADQRGIAITIFHLAIVENSRNHVESALSLFEKSLAQLSQLGDLWGIARVSQLLGQLFLKQGNYVKAQKFFDQHLTIDEKLQFREGIVVALRNLGNFHRYQGDYDQAEQFYERSLTTCREYGLKDDASKNLYFMGLLSLQQNDFPKALSCFTDFYDLARTVYERISAHDLFIGLAAIAGGTNQPERAAKLYGAAQESLDAGDNRFSPFDRAEFDRHIQVAQNQLGMAAFDILATEGRTMTIDQAIAYALVI